MKKGFTLIEIIAVLLMVSFLALIATISLLPMTEGFFQIRRSAEGIQKTHLALARIGRELITITNVVAAGQHTLTYDFLDPAGDPHRRTLSWNGADAPLLLNAVPLSDDVGTFELRYYATPDGAAASSWTADSRLIEFSLGTTTGPHLYTARIQPRNLIER